MSLDKIYKKWFNPIISNDSKDNNGIPIMYRVDPALSKVPAINKSFSKKIGFTKDIYINNVCNKKAYVVITPTPIKSISNISIDGIGSIELTEKGEYKSEEMIILPGKLKHFVLHTKHIYITVFIEVEENKWKQWKKNRHIETQETDYQITVDAVSECVEINFLNKITN